jgi:hypothetical protein
MLKPAEQKAFDAHVRTCAECSRAFVETQRAMNSVRTATSEKPLPVNFYVKLNAKLDAADEAAKKPVFNWTGFIRASAAALTMIVVGVFVYNIKNQTNNFKGVMVKEEVQMQASEAAGDVELKKEMPLKYADTAAKPRASVMNKKAEKSGFGGYSKDETAAAPAVDKNAPAAGLIQPSAAQKKDALLVQKKAVEANSLKAAKTKAAAPSLALMDAAPAPAAEAPVAEAGEPLEESELQSMESAGADMKTASRSVTAQESGPQTFIFKDAKNWEAFALSNGMKGSGEIDFTKEMVAVVYLAARPTEGYKVEIVNVESKADKVTISYREIAPAPGSINAQVITYPGTYVVMDRTDLPLEFVKVK